MNRMLSWILGALLASNAGVASHHMAALCYVTALAIASLAALMLPGKLRITSEQPAPITVE